MNLRALTAGVIATAAIFALPAIAEAAWGTVTANANLRTCPSITCARIGYVPDGARVWIGDRVNGWYSVSFNGRSGFVAGSLVASNDRGPGFGDFRGPPPRYGYFKRPWWDDRHHAWYDGRRWYRNGIWYNDPSGFSFGFSFGG